MKTLSKLKVVACITLAFFVTAKVNAQTTPANALRFNIGLETSIPTGNAAVGSNFSLGGTARLQYGITDKFALTFTSGAYHLFGKGQFDSYGIIPIKGGVKVFVSSSWYLGLEAGAGLEETKGGPGNKKFLLSPAFGWGCRHWDIGFHYEAFSGQSDPYGLAALRLAYGF